jgi:hypothetical protein
MPAQLPDDVTVLVLRRLAEVPTSADLFLSAGRA